MNNETSSNQISVLFSTSERTRILEYVLSDPSVVHKVNEIGRRTEVSKGAVSGYVQILVEKGIVRKKENDIILNIENPFVRCLKKMMNISKLSLIADELRKLNTNSKLSEESSYNTNTQQAVGENTYPASQDSQNTKQAGHDIIGVGVYGTWQDGTNEKQNVINFWIRIEKHPGEVKIAGLQNQIRQKFGIDASILAIDDKNLEQIKQDTDFYYLLKHSLLLYGEGLK